MTRYYVEFGAGTGVEANAVLLAECFGWSGLMIEADDQAFAALEAKYRRHRQISAVHANVSAANVEALFAHAGVPRRFDLLSIDIDGNDYWVWDAIESYRPRVVVVEYNGNLELDTKLVMPRDDDHSWDQTDHFGASLGAFQALAERKDYRFVHTESSGVNAFFVDAGDAERPSDLPPPARHQAN